MPNVQNSSKLEAVTVCIYYSNFLKYCVNNKKYLDRWIIVTVEDDVDTIEICKAYSLEFVFSTRAFNEDLVSNRNEKCHRDNWVMHLDCYSTLSREVQEFISTIPFNGTALSKGKAINDGMARLDRSGWLLHLDCDIVLPNNIRKFVDKIPQTKNNKESLFGLRGRRILGARQNFQGTLDFKKNQNYHKIFYREWLKYIKSENRDKNYLPRLHERIKLKCGIHTIPKSIKEQWADFINGKWNELIYPFDGPDIHHLGFFQLFHSSHCSWYSEQSVNIGVDDVLFREAYPKNRRRVLDLECVHICLPAGGMLDLPHLDEYVLSLKHHGEFSYLNRLMESKKAKSSKLKQLTARNLKSNPEERLYVARRDYSKVPVASLNLGWCVWKDTILKISPGTKNASKAYILTHEFQPDPKSSWFGFSLFTEQAFDKARFKSLVFELRLENLNCDLEVGYGDRNKFEWLSIKRLKMKNKTWYRFNLEFTKKNPINLLNTIFAIRSHGDYIGGKLCLGEIYLK